MQNRLEYTFLYWWILGLDFRIHSLFYRKKDRLEYIVLHWWTPDLDFRILSYFTCQEQTGIHLPSLLATRLAFSDPGLLSAVAKRLK